MVVHERRPVVRGEDGVVAADLDIARGVAGVLRVLPRSGVLHDAAAQAAGEPDSIAVDVGAGVLPAVERGGIVAELDADLLENGVGIVLDQLEVLVGDEFVGL